MQTIVQKESPEPPSFPLARFWGGLLWLLPMLVYGWFFDQYAINIPKYDDHALRVFLVNLEKAGSLHDKIYELFRQHNEHRIVLDRFFSWLDFRLTGKLNYVHLMVLGNLSLVLLFLVFLRALRKAGAAVWMALPVSLLLFNLSQWENMLWGMAALQNFTVMALAIATFYELAFKNRVGWLAILLPVLATITSGNGLLIWPVGLLMLFFRQDYAGVLRWLAALAITFRLYFLGYEKPAGNPVDQGSVLDQLHGWILFNGAAGEALPLANGLISSLLIGLVVIGLTATIALPALWRFFRGHKLTDWQLFFWGGAVFIAGTGLVVAINRVGFGLETLITSRYKIYSLTLLAFVISYWIATSPPHRRWRAALAGTVFSFFICFFSYGTYLDRVYYLRQFLTTYQFNYTYTQPRPVSTIDPETRRMIDTAPAFYDSHLPALFERSKTASALRLDTLYKSNDVYTIRVDSFPVLGLREEGAYVIARSPHRVYLFSTQQSLSGSRRRWLQLRQTFRPGFTAHIPETDLDRGTYDLQILAVGPNSQWRFFNTDRQITSSGKPSVQIQKNW
ncbi:hypothetical protein ACFPMF_02725 [Larkinella bovis]|uniref:YfhO family protein n=1 Tax=Larkinella bovis TaxID=683041 RepID=A0ABW0I4G9_9BACT